MSEPEFELGAYIAHLPPDLEGVAAPLYRRMAFISVSLLPTLRAGTGAGQDLPALEADLQAALAESQEKLSELQLAGDDYDPPLSDIVFAASEGGARDLKRIRATAQEAILHARRAVRAQARAEPLSGVKARAVLGLDTGGAYRSYRTSGAEGGDQVAQASSDMTTALERAVTLMSEELGKSTFSAELLQESSDAMAQLSGSYTSFEGLLQTSQAMVKKLKRQDVQDRIAVLASLTFFVLCVLYILKQRLVDPSFGGVAGLATGTYRTLRWGARLFTPASTAAVAGLAPPATTMSAAVAGMTSGSTAGAGLAFGATSSSGQARPIPSSAPVVPSAEKEPTWLATGVLEAERAPQATEWVWEHDPVLDAEWDTMAHSPEDTHAGTRLNSEVPSPPPTENEALYARQDIHAPHSINQSSFSEHVGVPQQEEDSGQAPITEETETATLQELEEATPREQAPSTSKSPLQELEKATPREHTQSTPKCPLTSEEAGEPYLTEGNLPSEHKVEFSGVIEGEASLTMEADSSVPREFQEADTLPQQADGALTMLGDRWVGPEIINAETTGDDRPVAEEGPCDDPQPPLQETSEAIVNAGTSTARAGAAGRTEPGRSAAQPSAASPASVGSVAASHAAPWAPDPGESEEPPHEARGHAVSDGVLDLFPVHDVAASSLLGGDDATAAQANTGMEETVQVPGHPGTETEATADTIIQAEPEPQLQPRPRPASVSEPRDGGSSGFASRDPHSARKEPELVVGDPASVPTEPKDEDFQAEHVRTRDAEISATLSSSGAAQQPYARHDDL